MVGEQVEAILQAARPTGGISRYYDAMFLLATMPLVRIAAVIGMWLAARLSLVW